MAINAVGPLYAVAANGVTTRSVTTVTPGDLLLVSILTSSNPFTVTGISGGNATGWVRLAGPLTGVNTNQEIWGGVVTAAGSTSPVTVAFSASNANSYTEIDVQEFTAGLGAATQWVLDVAGTSLNSSSTTITYPTLTAAQPGELYFGHVAGAGIGGGSPQPGGTPGFTYLVDPGVDQIVYNPAVSGLVAPTGLVPAARPTATVAVLMRALSTITTPTVTDLSAATFAGAGSFTLTPSIQTGPLSASFAGAGSFSAIAGQATPLPVAGVQVPFVPGPPTPPPPPPAPPTAAGLTLYGDLANLTTGDDVRGYPLRTFCDAAAGRLLQPLDDLCRDTAAGPGWSQVLDPNRAPLVALPWLGQFVGVQVDTAQSAAAQRTQISNEMGFQRGTPAAIIAATSPYLLPGQVATIRERDGDPYTLTVVVTGMQALGIDYADLSAQYATYANLQATFPTYAAFSAAIAAIRAAVQAAKPAALLASVLFVTQDNALLAGAGVFTGQPGISFTLPVFAGSGSMVARIITLIAEAMTMAGSGSFVATPVPSGPPKLLAAYYVPSGAADTSTLTTPSFTPAAGEVLVVKATTQDSFITVGSPSGGGQTYANPILLNASQNDYTELWTATVTGFPGAMSVATTFGGSNGWHSVVVERWGNAALAASPALGSSQNNTNASQTLTTVSRNSVVSWVNSDWNAINPGTPTLRGGATSEGVHYQSTSGGYTAYFGWQSAPVIGVQTFGVSSPGGQKASLAGIEIKSLTP